MSTYTEGAQSLRRAVSQLMAAAQKRLGAVDLSASAPFERCGHISQVHLFIPHNACTQVSVSFLEVYNEQLMDLLIPPESTRPLRLVEDPMRGVVCQNLTEVCPDCI